MIIVEKVEGISHRLSFLLSVSMLIQTPVLCLVNHDARTQKEAQREVRDCRGESWKWGTHSASSPVGPECRGVQSISILCPQGGVSVL